MARFHDLGGRPGMGPIDRTPHDLADWEILADALSGALGRKGIGRTDERRRVREDMDESAYLGMSYYERWIVSMEEVLYEKGVLTRDAVDRKTDELAARWGEP